MKKKLIIMILALAVLAAPACLLNGRQGVYMGGRFYTPEDNRDNSWTWYTDGGYRVTLDWSGDGTFCVVMQNWVDSVVQLDWKEDWARLTFEDGEILEGRWNGTELVNPDGRPLWMDLDDDIIQIIVEGEPEPSINRYTLAKGLCRMDQRKTEPFGSIALVALGVFMYAIGMLSVLFPEKMAMLGERWKYDSYELSDAGLISARLGGVVAMIGGVAIMYLPLFV